MDYKQEYLKLKRRLMEDDWQRGSGRLNPEFVKELSNLSFVVGDNVLGDDVHAVILSLVEEFNRIAANDLKHNLELSQYYAVGKGLMNKEGVTQCENCEIVLKYVDTTVCISNGRAKQHVQKEGDKYYHTNKKGEKTEINCNITRGLVRFYVKQKEGNTFKYTRVRVVRTQMVDSLQNFTEELYQNNDEIGKLEEATNVAISKGQSAAILYTANRGELESGTPDGITCSTKMVNTIISETKNASTQSQLAKMNSQRVLSKVPTQTSVDAANTVAKNMMRTRSANNKNMSVVLVPGNAPTPLQTDTGVEKTPATISESGISAKVTGGAMDTANNKSVNNRASIAVDANLAVLPTDKIVNDRSVTISEPSKKSQTAVANKLSAATALVTTKAQDIIATVTDKVEETAEKIKDYINTTAKSAIPQNSKTSTMNTITAKVDEASDKIKDYLNINDKTKETSVVPVSKDLSIMTPLPKEAAIQSVPVPQYETVSVLKNKQPVSASQQTTLQRFENKINGINPDTTVSINRSRQAVETVKNGNVNIKRTEETTKKISSNNRTNNKSATRLPTQQRTETTIETNKNKNRYSKLTENLVLSDFTENQPNTTQRQISQQTISAPSRRTIERNRNLY